MGSEMCIRDRFSNIAPQSGTMPSLDHRLNSWSRYKSVLFTFYRFTRGMSYSNILFVSELTSLESRRDQLSRSFFQDISHPSSSLYHLLPPPRDTSVLSRLRTATRFTRPISRTKNIVPLLITPYIIARYHPVTTSRLNPSLRTVSLFCVCCLLVLKLFLVYQDIRLLSRKTVNKYLYLYQHSTESAT